MSYRWVISYFTHLCLRTHATCEVDRCSGCRLKTSRKTMAKGKPGADSSVMVTNQVEGSGLIALAKALYGEVPIFWGRYFTSTSTGGTVEYRHLKENKALRDNNIRVLPIARQTKNV